MIKNTTIMEVKRGRCPHCKGKMVDEYPLYFVDVPNKMWLIYAPDEEKADEMLDNLSSYEGDFSKFKYVCDVKIGIFTSWDEFARYVQGLIKKTERRQKRAKKAGDLTVQTNTRLCQS